MPHDADAPLREFDLKLEHKQVYDTGATRDDATGKGRFDLIPFRALQRVAVVYEKGGKKHGDNNWKKGLPDERLYSSALRHIYQAISGETEEDHVAHAVWNLLAVLHFDSERNDRPSE